MLHGRRDVEKVLNERAEPPQSVQEEKRNRQAMAEDPPRQAEYTLISFSAGFLLYLMFTSANIANRQKILNPPRL